MSPRPANTIPAPTPNLRPPPFLASEVDDAAMVVEELQAEPDVDASEKLDELKSTLEDASDALDELQDEEDE